MVKVRCIYDPYYDDIELGRRVKKGDEFEVEQSRAEYLVQNKAVEIIEQPKQEVQPENQIEVEKIKPKKNYYKKSKK